MKKLLLIPIISLGLFSISAEASFSEKQIDDMVKKMNFQENENINTDIIDPFGYPEEKVVKKKVVKKVNRLKTKNSNKKKVEKKIIINYQGLIIDRALINGKSYKLNDFFNESQIIKITPEVLYLKQNDFIFEVHKNKKQFKSIIKEK